jgi:amidase
MHDVSTMSGAGAHCEKTFRHTIDTVHCSQLAPSPFASASDHATSIREKGVSCRELAELYVRRIHKHNPDLHAIVTCNEADALRTACERDNDLTHNIVRGPLHGVPVTVKEAFNLTGLRTTANFPQLKNNIATTDAVVVQKLKTAGATILGKTNIPTMLADYQSFGPLYPTANNPYDLTRTPGGSTGGGAAAVAANLTTLEIGSDLAGSIRIPAHFCGVFGLKPTENAMDGEGHVPPPPGSRCGFVAMACLGPLARTMTDIELAWTIINQPVPSYCFHLPQKPRAKMTLGDYRVAWFDDVGKVACGDETKKVLGGFLRLLASGGVKHEKRPFDDKWLNETYAVWGLLMGFIVGQHTPWIVRQAMKRQFSRMGRGSVINVLRPWQAGLDLRFKEFSRALKRRIELVQDLQRRFDEYDFIISPVAVGPAFSHNHKHQPIEMEGRTLAYLDYAMPYAIIYNGCGNPALVVPAGLSAGGLPIGIQIAAPHYSEPELIHFGRLIEQLGLNCGRPAGY